jgi:hypothetical protein
MKDVIVAYPGALDQGRPVPTVEWQGGPGAQEMMSATAGPRYRRVGWASFSPG